MTIPSTSSRDLPRVLPSGWSWGASLLFHGVLVAAGGWLALRSIAPPPSAAEPRGPAADSVVAVELPVVAEGALPTERSPDPVGEMAPASGGVRVARVDTSTAGRGGDPTVAEPAIHLSDVAEERRLSTDLLSRLDRDETQRVRSSASRSAWEDRRSTTHPAELTFVVSGRADRPERRAVSARDPSRGALVARAPAVRGGEMGTPDPVGDDDARSALGGSTAGSLDRGPGRGVTSGKPGIDHRCSAAVAFMRPDVPRGPVSVEAATKSRVRDDVDAEQEVSTVVRALVHESTAGGFAGPVEAAAPERGTPARAASSAPALIRARSATAWATGSTSIPETRASCPTSGRSRAKIEPLWADAFPASARLELKQGTVILEVVVAEDGSARVSWPPLRPSGIDAFDRNCADAVRRAAPFAPIPSSLHRSSLRIRAPFVASSVIVN